MRDQQREAMGISGVDLGINEDVFEIIVRSYNSK